MVNTGESYGGGDAIPSFFGMRWDTSAHWFMSRRMFTQLGIESRLRPLEGDLILIGPEHTNWRDPVYSHSMFEINYCRMDNPWWPLGRPYLHTLICQEFTYSHEKMVTNNPEIDVIQNKQFSPDALVEAGINKALTEKKNTLIDFSESNPFGNL